MELSTDPRNAITRLCMLQGQVAEVLGHDNPNDCFCGAGGFWQGRAWPHQQPDGWRSSGEAIEFIERVVRNEIERIKAVRAAACFADVEVFDG